MPRQQHAEIVKMLIPGSRRLHAVRLSVRLRPRRELGRTLTPKTHDEACANYTPGKGSATIFSRQNYTV